MPRGTILITGASSGLGAEMARQFGALGYDLALCARRVERLRDLRREILFEHPRIKIELAELDVVDDEDVFTTFRDFAAIFGNVDRVIVNAGSGGGAALGTGNHAVNRATAMTNFIGALTQVEAAMELFRARGSGHLVLISSVSALRGMRRSMTTYAATKAGVAAIAEGLQAEDVSGIDVSVIYPGYIRSEMNAHVAYRTRFMVDTEPGVRAMVDAIEKRRSKAYVPAWPWVPISVAMRTLPLAVLRRFA